jgi:hypothetical protein
VIEGKVGARTFTGLLKRLMHGAERPIFLIVDDIRAIAPKR